MHSEWTITPPDSPIEQGDILISRTPKTGQIKGLLLIITADCDIAQRKFGTHLACLRIVSLRDYFRIFWGAKKLRKIVDKEVENARALINKWNRKRKPDANLLSAEAVKSWICASQPESICTDLEVPSADQFKVKENLAIYRAALLALEGPMADDFDRFITIRSLISKQSIDECMPSVLKEAQSETLPDDVFVLPELPQLDHGPTIVLLRELTPIAISAVCFRSSEAVSSEKWLRIGRLEPTFKYAISQAFGSLYSRIGLPEFYEVRCKSVFDSIPNKKWLP
jgi:hypothetical protein